MGTLPSPGISEFCGKSDAQRCRPSDRAGRHRRGLGLSVCCAGQGVDARRTAHAAGLVSAVSAGQGPRRRRGRLGRWLCADLPDHRRSDQTAVVCNTTGCHFESRARVKHGCRRSRGGDGRDRVHGARPGVPSWRLRHREPGGQGRQRHPGSDPRRGARRARPGRAQRIG